ncbi:PQQ-like beta-propeller repeat protein [Stieleria sp. TO1_6]|uniref:outer membrane protein assembly factor BamB family protein n=1 Tax=Stieleria tagensis TaxID=2956795 RepID=UPI00209B0DB1|nr:PQQ-binding-like beta-propeller repeat protein [Stieleria tagensis]MCO8123980.1 PQQ-like beta-propeller repeat protein [Stieleria tagensis]
MTTFPAVRSRYPLIASLLCLCHLVACNAQTDSDSPRVSTSQQDSADQSVNAADRPNLPPVKTAAGGSDWPRLLGKDFDGVAPVEGMQLDWSVQPQVAWELPVGDGYGLGAVADGVYYQFDASRDGGQMVERLRALKIENAEPIWSVNRPLNYRDMYGYESGPRGTPAIQGDSIVTFGVSGELCCRAVQNGELRWSVDTRLKYGVVQNFFGVAASPLIWNDRVIVPVGGSPAEDQKIAPGRLDRVISNGSAVVAFDLHNGQELWRCGQDLASYSSPRTMQIGSQTIVLQFARDHLLAIDPEHGKVLWKQPHRADIVESVNAILPIVDADRIFISECYQVGSLLLKATPTDSEIVWQDPPQNRREQSMRCHWSTPLLIDGFLYGCSGRNNPDSDFRCVEFATGKVRWVDERRIRTSVTRVADKVIVWDEIGRMQIIRPNPERLDVVAEYDFTDLVSSPCWAAPIVVGNRMLIRGDEKVVCLAIAD